MAFRRSVLESLPMDAKEIRKIVEENVRGLADGSLDEDNLGNAMLGEIAAQLAEMNERADPDSGRAVAAMIGSAYKELLAAGNAIVTAIDTRYAKGDFYPDKGITDAITV